MIRVSPNWHDDLLDPVAIHDAVVAALMTVPRFPGGPLPVVIVLPRWSVEVPIYHLRYPFDPDSQRSLADYLLTCYGPRLGLRGFTSDGEDDEQQQEAEQDRRLIELLRTHPDGVLIDGTIRREMTRP